MAAHLEEQQELDNFKYFWKSTGRWLFALLIAAALGYLGYTMYKSHKASQSQEAAEVLAKIVDKMQAKASQAEVNADLTNLQQNYPDSRGAWGRNSFRRSCAGRGWGCSAKTPTGGVLAR